MDTLYHYTTLETLALILDTQKLRFSNLCGVDDPLEKYVNVKAFSRTNGEIQSVRENLGKCCFVSCWTREAEESIPMWDMYANRKTGVRIELPIDMFDLNYDINNIDKPKLKPLLDIKIPKIMPELIEISYDRIEDPDLISDEWEIELDNLGRFKIPEWSFQKECRFRIFGSFDGKKESKRYYNINNMMGINYPNPVDDDAIFFKLNDKAVSEIRVLIGPDMSKGQRILLEALMKRYKVADDRVKNSKFTDEEFIKWTKTR